MDFTVTKKNMLDALNLLTFTTPKTTNMLILQNVMIKAENGIIKMFSTDMEVSSIVKVDGDINTEGAVCIPVQKLQKMTKAAKANNLVFSVADKKLVIHSDKTMYKILSDDVNEFPVLPEVKIYDDNDFVNGSTKQLIGYAKSTMFAVAKDMSCYAYNGILIETQGNQYQLVSTDGKRLAINGTCYNNYFNTDEIKYRIVPVKFLNAIIKAGQDDRQFRIMFHDKLVIFESGNVIIEARCLEGDFPAWRNVIPNNPIQVTCNARNMFDGLSEILLTTGKEVKRCDFDFSKWQDRQLILSSENDDGETTTVVEISDLVGLPSCEDKITLNPDFVLDYLKTLSKTEMKNKDLYMCIKDEDPDSSPVVFSFRGNGLYIVMPITGK